MDMKTLRYMEERVEKGKELQKSIRRCKAWVSALEYGLSSVEFYIKGGYRNGRDFSTKEEDILSEIEKCTVEVIKKRIAELEQEFAEL